MRAHTALYCSDQREGALRMLALLLRVFVRPSVCDAAAEFWLALAAPVQIYIVKRTHRNDRS